MTKELHVLVNSLVRKEFDVKETMLVLKQNINIFWSWGPHDFLSVQGKGLMFKVQGRHHKGWVLITLNWDDTYIVNIINFRGRVLDTFDNVYFDDLVRFIDERVEKADHYQY